MFVLAIKIIIIESGIRLINFQDFEKMMAGSYKH